MSSFSDAYQGNIKPSFIKKLPRFIMIFQKQLTKIWILFGHSFSQILSKRGKLKEPLHSLIYNMEIQVLSKFHLKMTMIGKDITKKVTVAQIQSIFVLPLAKFGIIL